MAIDKITPRVLSKDKDQRIVTPNEFTDANNIRVTVDGQGNGGVIKNLKSDSAISMGSTLATGTNNVIGCYAFELINTVYVLLQNSEGNHSIWYYDLDGTTAELLLEEPALGFIASDYFYIDGVMFNNEPLLYLTNGRTEPIKINVNACIAGGWPAGSTIGEKMVEMAVIKAQPQAPTASFVTDTTIDSHSLIEETFQFAAQYVYRDGEESAIGQYSDLYVAPNVLNETIRTHAWETKYNKLEVSVASATGAVDVVRLYMRNDSRAPWYFVEEKDATAGVDTSFDFYNNKIYTILADVEANKLFDAVPKKASAQSFAGGRIVYGNYTEGFDVTAQSATITPVYNEVPALQNLGADAVLTHASNRAVIRVDLDDMPSSAAAGTYTLDVRLPRFAVSAATGAESVPLTFTNVTTFIDGVSTLQFETATADISLSAQSSAYFAIADFVADLDTAMSGTTIDIPVFTRTNSLYATIHNSTAFTYAIHYAGTSNWEVDEVTYVASAAGAPFSGNGVAEIKLKWLGADLRSHSITVGGSPTVGTSSELVATDFSVMNGGFYSGLSDYTSVFVAGEGDKTFKSGESHSFGVVFVDKYGRQSGVQELGSKLSAFSGAPERIGLNGKVHFDIDLSGIMPTWADKFFFVYGGGDNYINYTQYATTEAFAYTNGTPKVVVSLRGLQGTDRSYNDAKGSNISYTYSKGDRIRIISYIDDNGDRVHPYALEFDVVDFLTIQDIADAPFTATGGNTADQEERSVGQFIVVDPRNFSGFSHADTLAGSDFWVNECVVEIYNDGKKSTDSNVYYGCSELFPRPSYTNVIRITEGNAYFKQRLMIGFKWDSSNVYTPANDAVMQTYVRFIESAEYSDFSEDAAYYGKGKPSAVIYNEKESVRFSSLTWSEQVNTDSTALLTSSFNNAMANWYDLEASEGNIQGIANKSAFLVVMQKEGIALVKANTVFIQNAQDAISAINSSFIADHSYFDSKMGIQYRGSFVNAEGQVIGVDTLRGVVFSVGNAGVKVISENGMSKYFADYCRDILDHDARGNDDLLEMNAAGVGMVNLQLGYDRRNKEVIINRVDLTSTILPGGGPETVYGWAKDYTNKSIVYNVKEGVWTSFRNLVSDGFASASNRFFAARIYGGSPLHEQEIGGSYGIFFGTQYDPSFAITSALGTSGVKKYNAISIEGNLAASVDFTTRSASANLPKARFVEKEETFFSETPRAAGTSEYVTLGKVESISGSDVTFFNKVNRAPYRKGGAVYKLTGGVLSDVSSTAGALVSSDTVTFSNVASVLPNDVLVVMADSGVDGDQLSGHYLEAQLNFSNSDSEAMEIYAINLEFTPSSLHHEGNE